MLVKILNQNSFPLPLRRIIKGNLQEKDVYINGEIKHLQGSGTLVYEKTRLPKSNHIIIALKTD